MKYISVILFLGFFRFSAGNQPKEEQRDSFVFFGDPFIMLYDGVYYAYGTASGIDDF